MRLGRLCAHSPTARRPLCRSKGFARSRPIVNTKCWLFAGRDDIIAYEFCIKKRVVMNSEQKGMLAAGLAYTIFGLSYLFSKWR